ncbi:hypothetical protein GCM10023074_27820 [Microbispora amethystogenes]|uniref:Uncharacterized protein n=1 Tax=Microbispora amethystogenes TaxID=1427754 RepID=A0ABQ4F9R7_9ACTN|nr:hypothetical protein Mam01_17290 [Microbispora amethystogenes]
MCSLLRYGMRQSVDASLADPVDLYRSGEAAYGVSALEARPGRLRRDRQRAVGVRLR